MIFDDIAAFAAVQRIGALPAMQKIVTGAAGEAVIAKAALHRIIAEPGNHHVIAGAGIDGIGIAAVAVVQRIDPVALGVGQIAGIDGVIAGGALDNQAAGLERRKVHLERRRVHRDENVRRVTRSIDLAAAEIDLEGRNAEQRALRRADFRGEIGEGGQVVPRERGRQRELPTGQLHAVAGIAGKANNSGPQFLTLKGFRRVFF